MPCDTNYNRDNIGIYNTMFNDLLDSNLCNNVDHMVIGGDFNTDLSRTQSAHTMMCSCEFYSRFLLIILSIKIRNEGL